MLPGSVRRAALALPTEARAALAADMIDSLELEEADFVTSAAWDAAWGEELERRADEATPDNVASVAADEVFAEARRRRAVAQ